jgi:hypothetical protein
VQLPQWIFLQNKFQAYMIHIVFQRNDVDALKRSFELEPSLEGEVILIEDDFAVGPLKDI